MSVRLNTIACDFFPKNWGFHKQLNQNLLLNIEIYHKGLGKVNFKLKNAFSCIQANLFNKHFL